jgi:type II secretory pathway predicted ATPase ExeA
VPSGSYERYGLTGNPFRDLTSESLEDIEVFHVNLETDQALRNIKEEVLDKENRAFVALVGNHGTGKTHRLRVAQAEAKARGAFCVYDDISEKGTSTLKTLAHELLAAKPMGGFSKLFSAPPWYREIAALEKAKDGNYDPIKTGKAIARALNDNAPAFLLLNDLQNVAHAKDAELFLRTFEEIADAIKPGALVMFGCYPSYLVTLSKSRPGLSSRINRTFLLPTVSIDEASLLIAKKLLAKRIVENLDPLYPFDREAVAAINTAAYGNPRRLLELADRALEYAVDHRSYRVDSEVLKSSMPAGHSLDTSSAGTGNMASPAASHATPPLGTGGDLRTATARSPSH